MGPFCPENGEAIPVVMGQSAFSPNNGLNLIISKSINLLPDPLEKGTAIHSSILA